MLHGTFLSGYVWTENAGWITLGDGSPGAGGSYGNTDGGDCGVNVDPFTGELSGMAWGENIGWINMRGGAPADLEAFQERAWREDQKSTGAPK